MIQSTGAVGDTYTYDSEYDVTYSGLPVGVTIERVTLLRAGSVTHHADCNQRYIQLSFQHLDTGGLRVKTPKVENGTLPRDTI